jgi:(2Fe-2S) ferredoxin
MGLFKDLTQELQKKPWIPFGKKESEPPPIPAASKKAPQEKAATFCDPKSNLPCLTVCVPKPGCSCGCDDIRGALTEEIAKAGLDITIGSAKVGCSGSCGAGPFIGFPQKGFFYLGVRPERIRDIVAETLVKGRILLDLISTNPDRSYRTDIYYENKTGFIATIHDQICMVEVAKYFLDFEENVSCGKCVPCRLGMKRMHESIQKIVAGSGTEGDLEQIRELCQAMIEIPHCEFAMTSSRPVLSAITYFEDEFKAHIEQKECPAGVCKELIEQQKKEAMKRKRKKK